jgi:hypothetical protein
MTPDVQERLEKLERQNRRLKCGGAVALIALGALVLMGQTASKSHTIRAEEFQLVDSHDKLMGRMRVDGKNPELELFNQNGAPTVALYAYDNGNTGGLLLSDIDSGATARTSAASLLMTRRDGKVLWRAPMGNAISNH